MTVNNLQPGPALAFTHSESTACGTNVMPSPRVSCSPSASDNPPTASVPPVADFDNPQTDVSEEFSERFRIPLRYIMLIGNMGGIAVTCLFYGLSLDDSQATNTVLFLMVTNVVLNLQSCSSEALKLHYDLHTSWRKHALFYFLVATSAVLTIGAPIVYSVASGGDQHAPIMLLCATLLMCVNGCIGALDTAIRKDESLRLMKADEESVKVAKTAETSLRRQNTKLTEDLEAERKRNKTLEDMRERVIEEGDTARIAESSLRQQNLELARDLKTAQDEVEALEKMREDYNKQRKALKRFKRESHQTARQTRAALQKKPKRRFLGLKQKAEPRAGVDLEQTYSWTSADNDIMAIEEDRGNYKPNHEILFPGLLIHNELSIAGGA